MNGDSVGDGGPMAVQFSKMINEIDAAVSTVESVTVN